ncbi:DUF1499 domain-containing protein [Paracoccaceae bacterium Fryx2]|nr:DUF1499 domain-containing protein [Paracoccaceae bacterium Fryx2]
MKTLAVILGLVVVLLGAVAVWVRVAPTDTAVWHVDPATAAKPDKPNHWLLRADGEAPALQLALPPDQAAARLAEIAAATPRTIVLAGQGDHVTWVTRSALFGFPDYTSVRITPTAAGSEVTIFARARFGYSDMAVNRKRVEDWAARLAP